LIAIKYSFAKRQLSRLAA